jgi:hypothetical protein
MKVFVSAVLFVALVSLACSSTTSSVKPTITSGYTRTPTPTWTPGPTYFARPTPTYITNTPWPSNTPTREAQVVATLAAGFGAVPPEPAVLKNNYSPITCEVELPKQFTYMRCYMIDEKWTEIGVILYNGNEIGVITIGYLDTAPQDIVEKGAKFVFDVATIAGWSISDISSAIVRVANAQEQGWITYNTIDAQRNWHSNGLVIFMFRPTP